MSNIMWSRVDERNMKDMAAGWPDNPDGPGAARNAAARADRARAAIAKAENRQ